MIKISKMVTDFRLQNSQNSKRVCQKNEKVECLHLLTKPDGNFTYKT